WYRRRTLRTGRSMSCPSRRTYRSSASRPESLGSWTSFTTTDTACTSRSAVRTAPRRASCSLKPTRQPMAKTPGASSPTPRSRP
ncbi:MAG: hypothetical protein AVDCRST_MAG14-1004, partial [uncultured Rubrobacteraceae bacterium]